jgi:hypothetical protein
LAGQNRKYIASCWIKTQTGFQSGKAALVFHTKRDNDNNNNTYPNISAAYKSISVGDTQGRWVYVQAELDVKDIRTQGSIPSNEYLRLRVFPRNTDDSHYMLVDDIRVFPKDALINTQDYDPKTFQVLGQIDKSAVTSITEYDSFQRPIGNKNTEGRLLNSTYPYYSRDGNSGNFVSTDPNYIRTVTTQSDGTLSTFNTGYPIDWTTTSTYWVVENGEYSQSDLTNQNTNSFIRYYKQSGRQYYRWKITFVEGSIMAGLHFMVSDSVASQRGNAYLIWQYKDAIRLYKSTNNNLATIMDFTGEGENGKTYTYEVLYNPSTGRMDLWRDGKYLGNWTDTPTTKITSGKYLCLRTNKTHAHFDDVIAQGEPVIQNVFSDGLGREIQTQVWDDNYDNITKTVYNTIGKKDKFYFPQKIDNATHVYYRGITGNYYERYTYCSDPLARPYQVIHPNTSGTVTYAYGCEGVTVKDINHNNATYTCSYQRVTDETNKISTTYYDKFGNAIAVTTSPLSTKSSTIYDILGHPIYSKPPNYHAPPRGTAADWDSEMRYNTLGFLVYEQTPDEGITKYVYDKNGNLRYSQDAFQRASTYDFTVTYYDAHNRVLHVGQEDDIEWNATDPDPNNTTYGTEASEWKIKNDYDANFVTGADNRCQGQLTRTRVNDDADDLEEHTTTYVYDKFGNLTEKRIVIDNGTPITEKVVKHKYDLLGREIELTYPTGKIVARSYDNVGRLKKIYNIQ